MVIVIVFALSLISVSFVQSDPPALICQYNGATRLSIYPYSINIPDIPEECNVILYSQYFFNENPMDSDKTDIAKLKSAGKAVYMMYVCPGEQWDVAISSKDPNALDKLIEPMLTGLKENQIDGVILFALGLQDGTTPDYATKINTFISKIKSFVPKIKVGLELESMNSHQFSNASLFDFTVVNANVDIYDINVWSFDCQPKTTAMGGRLPLTSTDPKVLTLETICKDVSSSQIDKTKIVAGVMDYATISSDSETPRSYTDYCRRKKGELWCGDTLQIQYDQVKYLKKNKFKGLVIAYVDLDDYDNSCGCGKFPVTKTFIDAWEDKPITCCDNIS